MNPNNGGKPDPQKGTCIGLIINQSTGEIPLAFNIAHRDPMGKLIGGRMKYGETPLIAFIREVSEESGLTIDPHQAVSLFTVLADNKKHYYHVFACVVDNFDGLHKEPVKDGKDLLEIRMFTEDTLASAKILLQHRVILKQAIGMIRG